MKRDAYYALIGGMAVVLAMPSAAQPAAQTPTPVVQPAPTIPSASSAAVNEQGSKSAVPKEKPCEAVMIRAGPNQGQLINKCRHTSKLDTRPNG
jgi:hypothetical protein